MANVSWCQLIVLGFQNNSFLIKVAYNQVHKWPLLCFWHFCWFHPFLAKILFYLLRAQKTNKSYLRNGAFLEKNQRQLMGFPQTLKIKSGVENHFRAKNYFCYWVTQKVNKFDRFSREGMILLFCFLQPKNILVLIPHTFQSVPSRFS